jgi:hypothetical protein
VTRAYPLHRFNPSTIQHSSNSLPNPAEGIIKFIHHPLLQRDDRVIGDLNILRANFCAALRDIAITDAVRIP